MRATSLVLLLSSRLVFIGAGTYQWRSCFIDDEFQVGLEEG